MKGQRKRGESPIPDPEPGQVWKGPTPAAKPRKVLNVVQWPNCKAVVVEGRGQIAMSEWKAWARKAAATPQEAEA